MTERSWVQIPPGAMLFPSLLYPVCLLNQLPRGGATLLIFLIILIKCICGTMQLEAKEVYYPWIEQNNNWFYYIKIRSGVVLWVVRSIPLNRRVELEVDVGTGFNYLRAIFCTSV